MSSAKTDSLQLNKWVPTDYVSMSEFNDNFQKIDDAHKGVTTQLADNTLNALSYGAVGNAVTNDNTLVSGGGDTTALQNMINSAISNKKSELILPTRKYLITNYLTVPSDVNGLTIDGRGSTLVFNNTTVDISTTDEVGRRGMFYIAGEVLSETSITAYETYTIPHTQRFFNRMGKFTVTNASDFAKGDSVVIYVKNRTQTYSEYIPCMNISAKVVDVDKANNIIYTDYYSPFDFSNFTFRTTDVIKKVKTAKNVTIKNFYLHDVSPFTNYDTFAVINSQRTKSVSGIGAYLAENIKIKNVHAKFNKFPVVRFDYVHTYNIDNVTTTNPAMIGSGEGYVFQANNSYNGRLNQLKGQGERHIVDFSGSAFATVTNSQGNNSAESSFDCHGICEHDIVFDNCSGGFGIGNGISAFPELSDKITLRKCKGKLISNNSSNLIIDDCDLELAGLYTDGDMTIKDSQVNLTFNSAFAFRQRGRTGVYGTLTFDNVKFSAFASVPSTAVVVPVSLFKEVRMSKLNFDFGDKPYCLNFLNNERIQVSDVYRKNTWFLFETTQPTKIDYIFNRIITEFDAVVPLRNTYPVADRISKLTNATGRVKFKDCVYDYNSDSNSYPISIAEVKSGDHFNGSSIDLVFDTCDLKSATANKIILDHYDISTVSIYYRNNKTTNILENGMKMSEIVARKHVDYGFRTATLQNNWVSSLPYVAGYQLSPDYNVMLQGVIISGTASSSGITLFTLPVGYRPKRQLMYQVATRPSTGGVNPDDRIIVKTTGEVVLNSSDALYGVFLSGICFSIL